MHPILFKIGGIKIYTYYLTLGIGMSLFFLYAYLNHKTLGMDRKNVISTFIIAYLAGLIGWRVIYLLWLSFRIEEPDKFIKFMWGNSLIGIFTLGGFASLFFLKSKKMEGIWKFYDGLTIPLVLLFVFIKLCGCLPNGCCFGTPTSLPWGIKYPSYSYPAKILGDVPLHPAPLYDALGGILLAMLLSFVKNRKRFDGEICLWLVLGFGIIKFFLEFYRYNPHRHPFLGMSLTLMQIVSLFITPLWGIMMALIYTRKMKKRDSW